MRVAARSLTGKKIDSWWIRTFHSVSARILRRYFNEVGLKENFVIIDKEDQIKIIKNICENEKIDSDKKNPKYFLKCIDQFKNENLTVEKVLNDAKDIDEINVANIYAIYEDELKRLNCCDFGNLIIHCLSIFKKNKNILKQLQISLNLF